MSSYGRFADFYDELMQDIPYEKYVEWVVNHAPSEHYSNLLDVGCGTGTLALMFHRQGYQVSGIDLSEEMLSVAYSRGQELGASIPFFAMSMDELEGFADLDVIVIPIDSINYLQEETAVYETLKRMYNALRDGGQLFFDVHSLFKMNEIFMSGPFTYDDGELLYVWHTEEGEEVHSVFHQMTFFAIDEKSGLFERFDEEHYQRTFPIKTYVNWLKEVGFSNIEITSDFTNDVPTEYSERIFFRAVK